MALTASSLISAAKKRAYGSLGRQKVSDAMLLEELSYQDQLIVQMISQIAPDLLSRVNGSFNVTDTGNTNGYTLQNGIHYRDFTHVDPDEDEYTKINLVQRQHQDSPGSHPAGFLRTVSRSGVFYPIDPEGDRWQSSDERQWFEPDENHQVKYSYVPFPVVIDEMSDTLVSPDMAREVIVSSLVLTLLFSADRVPEARVQAELAKRQGAMDSLRMQAYKFSHPQGQPGREIGGLSESAWVQDQVSD